MNKEKQIEEMAKVIEQARIKATDTTNSMNYGFDGWYAKELYTAGYRKQSEVAREIFEEIEELAKIYTFPVVKNGVVEIVKEPFWCFDPNDLAELKKKYTESEDTE